MILLYSILLVSIINVSYQELSTNSKVPDTSLLQHDSGTVTSSEILKLRLQISQQNTKFEHQNVILAEQKIKFLEFNVKIKDLELKIEELEKKDNQHIQLPTNNSTFKGTGSIFTRWGRRDCPSNISQLVYSGITGGSSWQSTGGAAEYVCLPTDPTWNVDKNYTDIVGAYMYGSEYELVPKPIQNYNPPCVVCRTSQFSTVLMIPAKSECHQGWKKAYNGELASGNPYHAVASQYVCLDEDPQTNGTTRSEDGKLMYSVRAQCGSLPCPPYENDAVLTCVVCLK